MGEEVTAVTCAIDWQLKELAEMEDTKTKLSNSVQDVDVM